MNSRPHGVHKEFNSLMEVYSHIFHISNTFVMLLTLHLFHSFLHHSNTIPQIQFILPWLNSLVWHISPSIPITCYFIQTPLSHYSKPIFTHFLNVVTINSNLNKVAQVPLDKISNKIYFIAYISLKYKIPITLLIFVHKSWLYSNTLSEHYTP